VRITEDEVRYVADLANLKLTDAEVSRFRADLDEILTHVDRLNQLAVTDVEPMTQVLYDAEETATLRPDRERPPLGNAAALSNAPLKGAGYFKVPEVIKK
jgi:aspartyl-tRNA(Asn)/glutamyl-tRNA(Gln) amidotransferase subunit C